MPEVLGERIKYYVCHSDSYQQPQFDSFADAKKVADEIMCGVIWIVSEDSLGQRTLLDKRVVRRFD